MRYVSAMSHLLFCAQASDSFIIFKQVGKSQLMLLIRGICLRICLNLLIDFNPKYCVMDLYYFEYGRVHYQF